jgi:hypothetical protein
MGTGAQIKVETRLLNTQSEINSMLIKKLKVRLYGRLNFLRAATESAVRGWVQAEIQKTPTWASLEGGDLRHRFGIENPQDTLPKILEQWTASVKMSAVKMGATTQNLQVTYQITAIDASYQDVLDLGSYTYNRKGGGIERIAWLEWLLLRGSAIVIPGYVPIWGDFPDSRTENMIMVPTKNGDFSVPDAHKGSAGNNFITKMIEENKASLSNTIIIAARQALN